MRRGQLSSRYTMRLGELLTVKSLLDYSYPHFWLFAA
jgi:hypothetical protein